MSTSVNDKLSIPRDCKITVPPISPQLQELYKLAERFAYEIVCEVQDLKDMGITMHPLNWFDDFEELEYLETFLKNYLNKINKIPTTLDEMYYIITSIPYEEVVSILINQGLPSDVNVETEATVIVDDSNNEESREDSFVTAVEEVDPPQETVKAVGTFKQLRDYVVVDVMAKSARVAKALAISSGKKVALLINAKTKPRWKRMKKYCPSTAANNYFSNMKARCIVYVPSKEDIEWLKTNTLLDFNDTNDMKWKSWKPIVVTDNPRIAGRGRTNVTYIPPRSSHWQNDPDNMMGYDAFKVKTRMKQDDYNIVVKIGKSANQSGTYHSIELIAQGLLAKLPKVTTLHLQPKPDNQGLNCSRGENSQVCGDPD